MSEAPKKKGLFARLREGLSKTRGNMTEKVDDLVRENRRIDEDFYEELEDILLMADCGVKATTSIIDELRERVSRAKMTDAAEAREALKQIMVEYEVAVGTDGIAPEDALTDYTAKLRVAFNAHSAVSAAYKEKTENKLNEIADEYTEISKAFRAAGEAPAAEEAVTPAEAEEAAAPAEEAAPQPDEVPAAEETVG